MKRGMLTITGQPATHFGSLHCKQRSASNKAIFSGRPRLTSSKLALRISGSCSAIFCRSICRRCFVVILAGMEKCGSAQSDLAIAFLARGQRLLLELAIGAQPIDQYVEIHLVTVELRP